MGGHLRTVVYGLLVVGFIEFVHMGVSVIHMGVISVISCMLYWFQMVLYQSFTRGSSE